MDIEPFWLTVPEAAAILRLSPVTLYHWSREGRLDQEFTVYRPTPRRMYLSNTSVQRWIQAHQTAPATQE